MSDDHGPGGFAAGQLKSFVERIERLDGEIKDLNDDKRDVYAEAKANGFDVKVLRHVIKVRAQDADARSEFETLTDLYLAALGMLPGEPVEAPSRARAPARTREEPADVRVQLTNGEKTVDIDPELLSTLVDASKSAAGTAIVMAAIETVKAAPPKAPDVEPEMPAFLVRTKPTAPAVPA